VKFVKSFATWQHLAASGCFRVVSDTLALNVTWYNTLRLQVDPASSSMAIIIAAQNGSINVHANKAIPNSGAGYLALALRKRRTSLYDYYVPGCNSTGRSFISIVSVYDSTEVRMYKYVYIVGVHTMQVQSNMTRTEC